MSLTSKTIESPVGKLKLVASDKGLAAVLWEDDRPHRVRLGEPIPESTSGHQPHPVLVQTERQLNEYFAGRRKEFSLPLDQRHSFSETCVGGPACHTIW